MMSIANVSRILMWRVCCECGNLAEIRPQFGLSDRVFRMIRLCVFARDSSREYKRVDQNFVECDESIINIPEIGSHLSSNKWR